MGTDSGIDYVDHSLGFWRGCTPVSEGCDHCYAYRDMRRHRLDPTVVRRCAPSVWRQPLVIERTAKGQITKRYKWRPGSRVFVCSWSDFFHPDADKWRAEAWDVIYKRPDLIWIIVTKRPERITRATLPNWWVEGLPNVWFIATTENQKMFNERCQLLFSNPALRERLLGVSIEPMLGSVDISAYADLLQWVLIGAESGNEKRFCDNDAVAFILDICELHKIPCFVKQVHIVTGGGVESGSDLKPCGGKVWTNFKLSKEILEWPEALRVRQYPYEITNVYRFNFGTNQKQKDMQGRPFRVVTRSRMNSCLIEFLDNGQREVVSRNALRIWRG